MHTNQFEKSYRNHLMNFIKSKVSCAEDAKDIYQEVIVKIIHKSASLAKEESLKSWIFTIARNQIVDYYRSRKKTENLDSFSGENIYS